MTLVVKLKLGFFGGFFSLFGKKVLSVISSIKIERIDPF